MGNSSSTYIANRLNPTTESLAWHKYPHHGDTAWLRRRNTPEIPPLPPFDIAQGLYRAQHAYIGTIFCFLSDQAFEQRLRHVYDRILDPEDREDRLIYCQVLLVFAFGQMYSINQWVDKDGPPGFVYFKHALDFLPNMYEEGSILFIEVLSYVAYFMQTINRRDAAYLIIGVALRMAISLGLHQEVSDQDIDRVTREHRRRVWWSTYSMERLLCVTSGHPLSIQDEDIDVLPPNANEVDGGYPSLILGSYTELSRIQGIIGEKIYRKKQKSGPELSACVQDIMKRLSDWFEKLPESIRSKPPDLAQPPSREIVSTYLHYYHCINMTARPILLYAVQRQLAPSSYNPNPDGWKEGLSQDIVHVIDRATSAARSSASILSAAIKYNLVGKLSNIGQTKLILAHTRLAATYGFIDGEQAFSAALLLVMVNIAFPYKEADAVAMEMALGVLQTMAEKGNRYIKACHTLLTKIRSTMKPNQRRAPDMYSRRRIDDRTQDMTPPQSGGIIPEPPQEGDMSFGLDFEGDPALWAEVLESMDIDMDRQWIETALQREELLETPDSMN